MSLSRLKHAADALLGAHGKGDVNDVHFACPGLLEQVVEIADATGRYPRERPECARRRDRRKSPRVSGPFRAISRCFCANWKPNSVTPTMAKFRLL